MRKSDDTYAFSERLCLNNAIEGLLAGSPVTMLDGLSCFDSPPVAPGVFGNMLVFPVSATFVSLLELP